MDRLMPARVVLAEAAALGVTIEDLIAESAGSPDSPSIVPTVAEYVETVKATFSKGTADTYQSYWRLAVLRLGDRRIDSIGVDDCEAIVAAAVERARRNRPGTEGRSARENCIGALRALFARAERAGLIAKSPAADLDKPRRLPNRRRALEDHELREDRDTTQNEGTPTARCESDSGSAGATGPVTSALTKPASLELRHLWCQRSTRMEHSGPGASPSRPSPVRSSQSRVSASAT